MRKSNKTKPTPVPKNKDKFRKWKHEQDDMINKQQQTKRHSKLNHKTQSVAIFDKYFIDWEKQNEENKISKLDDIQSQRWFEEENKADFQRCHMKDMYY